MPLKESEAFVLRTFPLGEGDRLVSFLDRQSGRLRGVARGPGCPRADSVSTLRAPLLHSDLVFRARDQGTRPHQSVRADRVFPGLQKDYQAGIFWPC